MINNTKVAIMFLIHINQNIDFFIFMSYNIGSDECKSEIKRKGKAATFPFRIRKR
jgi:hypothetical protein